MRKKLTILNSILKLELGAIEKSILYAICIDSDSKGISWCRRARLVKMVGVSESTLKRKMAALRKCGLIKTIRTPGASKNMLDLDMLDNMVKEQEYGGASKAQPLGSQRNHQGDNLFDMTMEERYKDGD